MGSGFPRKICSNVHDSGQVCMFQGKNGRDFGSGPLLTLLGNLFPLLAISSHQAQMLLDQKGFPTVSKLNQALTIGRDESELQSRCPERGD